MKTGQSARAATARIGRALRRRWKVTLSAAVVTLGLVVGLVAFSCSDDEVESFRLRTTVPAGGAPFASALYQSLGVRMTTGHDVAWLDNGVVFDRIVEEIGRAKSSVHLLLYIWEKGAASDRVSAALIERAKSGVRCRILVDDLGSRGFMDEVAPPLVAAGCEVRIFRPLPGVDKLARNHRKLVVVDGRVAITGGFGIRDNWLGDGIHDDGWRDANARFAGPAVNEAQQAFAENWQEAGGDLLPAEDFPEVAASGHAKAAFITSTASPVLSRSERLTQLMIAAATKRIWISNAYFVPSRAILDLLGRKASEGVDVRLLTAGKKSDSKTSFGAQQMEYGDLVERGMRIWEYRPSMMHAKTMLVDDDLVLVGSINLEPLSLNKLEEVALVVDDRAFAEELAASFAADCEQAKEISE